MTKKDGYDEISIFCLFSSISACQNLFVSPYRPLHAKMPLQVFDISLGERSVPHSTLTLASSRAPSLLLVFNLGKSDAVKLDDDFSKADMQSDSCLTLLFHQKHFYCFECECHLLSAHQMGKDGWREDFVTHCFDGCLLSSADSCDEVVVC